MRVWKQWVRSASVGIMVCLLSGCSPFVENNTIEEIAPVIFWSINDGGKGKLEISTMVPPLIKEQKRMVTLQVDLLKEGGRDFNLVYYRELKSGQLRMLLINEAVAKKGLSSLINTVFMDPDISQRIYLVIVKGDFTDYIKSQLDKQPNQDYFLYRMFKHYEEKNQGEMTVVNMHEFMKKLYSPYADPVLPVFKASPDNFSYEGTALFKKERMVGTVKGADEQLLQLINNDYYLGYFPIPELAVTLGHLRSDPRMEWNEKESTFSLRVRLTGRIEEYRGSKLTFDQAEFTNLTREIDAYMEKQTRKLLNKMQQLKVYPLNNQLLPLTPFSNPIPKEQWMKQWESMKIKVEYELKIDPLTSVNK